MTNDRRFEAELPDRLADLYLGPSPAYRDAILQRAASVRQRPAWSFPERWLPMSAITARSTSAPVSWRPIAYAILLLALALAIGIGAFIATRPRVPAPYGPAGNGLIVYASGGDVYVTDPLTGTSQVIVGGPEADVAPAFSLDGTRLFFLRGTPRAANAMVANADGSDPRAVTPVPLVDVTGGDWSADGRILLLVSAIDGHQAMSIIDVEQRTMRTLDVGMPVREATFQPPNDEAIAFIGEGADGDGLYLMDRDGREPPRPLVSASSSKALARFLSTPAFSPDGSRIAYVLGDELVHRVHIINADGTSDLAFEHPPGVLYQNYPTWSPDGAELLVSRTHAGGPPFEAAILPADGSGIGRVVGPELSSGRAAFSWSPDGASIVVTFEPVEVGEPARAALVIDAVDGTYRDLPTTESWLVWQRVAP